MLAWLQTHAATIIISAILIVAIVFIVKNRIVNVIKGEGGCGCGCDACGQDCHPDDAASVNRMLDEQEAFKSKTQPCDCDTAAPCETVQKQDASTSSEDHTH